MSQHVDAIYENGLLRPLQAVDLRDQECVRLTIESCKQEEDWLDQDALDWAKAQGDPTIPLAEVRRILSGLKGSLADAVIADRGDY